MFGFAGSHRSGKTTLAKSVAERMGFHYHDASVTKIAKEFGVNVVGDLPMSERMDLQEFILKRFMEEVKKAPILSVCDRTPLDMIGYMLGEVTMHNTPIEFHERIQTYVDSCLSETTKHFDMVLVVRPLPFYAVDPNKPPPNRAYQTLVQMIIEGAGCSLPHLKCGPLTSTNRNERLVMACTTIAEHLSELALLRETMIMH